MKLNLILVLLLVTFPIYTWSQSFPIGHQQHTFIDPARSDRSIATEIYYPATSSGEDVDIADGIFPVIVFGHGFLMEWTAYAPQWTALVPEGYIVIFPTTESSFLPSHTNFGQDLAFLVGAMKAEGSDITSPFYNAISPKAAVMGHSMGGGSAFLAVQYDPSITALATLAAANTTPSSIEAASAITIPSLVIAGANDCVTPIAEHQSPMYAALSSSCKTFVSITGASHCQFAASNINCSFGEATCTPSPTISREEQHATTFALLIPWLNYYLKNDVAAGIQFQEIIDTDSTNITATQNCELLSTPNSTFEQQLNIDLFPNPFSDKTNLISNIALHKASLTIYNILGQAVYEDENINGTNISITPRNIPGGMYFLRLTQEGKVLALKKLEIID